MNNILSTKRNSAIFLGTLLVLGTIVTILPSVQAQPYYNSYEPQYPTYKPDYKTKYPSDNNNYKSKDSNTNINKLKCVNTNLNINGNNTGDINIGNKDRQGDLGVYSSNGGGYGGGEGYDNNPDKGFECIINNNNTNTNIVAGGAGNVTETTGTLAVSKSRICNPIPVDSRLVADYCNTVENTISPDDFNIIVTGNEPNPSEFPGSNFQPVVVTLGAGDYEVTEELPDLPPPPAGVTVNRTTTFAGNCADVDPSDPESIVAMGTIEAGESQTCDIGNAYEASTMTAGGLTASNMNTDTLAFDINTSGSLASSFSSPPTIAQETTKDDLTAMEKIIKLKQQWIELTP